MHAESAATDLLDLESLSHHERCARRSTDCVASVCVRELNTALSELIQVRSADARAVATSAGVDARLAPPHVVGLLWEAIAWFKMTVLRDCKTESDRLMNRTDHDPNNVGLA